MTGTKTTPNSPNPHPSFLTTPLIPAKAGIHRDSSVIPSAAEESKNSITPLKPERGKHLIQASKPDREPRAVAQLPVRNTLQVFNATVGRETPHTDVAPPHVPVFIPLEDAGRPVVIDVLPLR